MCVMPMQVVRLALSTQVFRIRQKRFPPLRDGMGNAKLRNGNAIGTEKLWKAAIDFRNTKDVSEGTTGFYVWGIVMAGWFAAIMSQ